MKVKDLKKILATMFDDLDVVKAKIIVKDDKGTKMEIEFKDYVDGIEVKLRG